MRSNNITFDALDLYVNKYSTPYSFIAVEVTTYSISPKTTSREMCTIAQGVTTALSKDTFYITQRGFYNHKMKFKVSGAFLLVLNHIYVKEETNNFKNLIYFGIGTSKFSMKKTVNVISLGYIKQQKNSKTIDLRNPYKTIKNEPISIQLSFN